MQLFKYRSKEVKVWFTSDTHFGHSNIIKFCHRPFKSLKEMDEKLIENWNERVKPGDKVFHLGDFCFGCKPGPYIERLNGDIHLINGSHDKWTFNQKAIWFNDGKKKVTISDSAFVRIDTVQLFLAHHAHRVWPKSHYGVCHLYGHSHGRLLRTPTSVDIGVDCTDFKPWGLEEVLNKLNQNQNTNNDKDNLSRE